MTKIPPDILLRLPDSTLVGFLRLFGESLEQVEQNICAQFASGIGGADWTTKFMQVAVVVDSALAVRWADALEAWVWTLVDESPVRTMASKPTTVAFVQDILGRLSAKEREALDSIGRREQVDPAVSCALARSLYREMSKGPAISTAPVLRMLIAGEVPFNSTV